MQNPAAQHPDWPDDPARLQLDERTLDEWQGLVDIMAELADIPAGLIMRLTEDDIEVLLASRTDGNPYRPGDREHFLDSGLYCETAIRTRSRLVVPDALADPDWEDNPDVELGMISYLGYPIMLPNDVPFGTLCILDRTPSDYSPTVQELVRKFRDLIQYQLELIWMNEALGEENRRISDHLEEIQALRGLIPICAWCKKIRDGEGYWNAVENYLVRHPGARLSHAICPTCEEQVVGRSG